MRRGFLQLARACSAVERAAVSRPCSLGLARAPLGALRRPLSSAVASTPSSPAPPQQQASSGAAASSGGRPSYFDMLSPDIGPLALNEIRDNVGARRKKRRVGRGVGSGRGRTSGRGHKGTKQRAGNHGLIKKDGGQTRLQKALPKMGDWKPTKKYQYIKLSRVQEAVRTGRLAVPADRPIDVKDLFDAKLVTLRQQHWGVKLLGQGAEKFNTPLRIEVQLASQGAIEAIEAAGGSIESVYYNKLTLRAKLKPHRFEAAPPGRRHGDMRPRPALPPPKLMRDVYLTERHRGYLRNLAVGEVVRPQEHPAHVDLSARAKPRYPGWAAADSQAMAEGKPFIKADGELASADERAAAQKRSPRAWEIMKESPTRPRDRAYAPPLPPKPRNEE